MIKGDDGKNGSGFRVAGRPPRRSKAYLKAASRGTDVERDRSPRHLLRTLLRIASGGPVPLAEVRAVSTRRGLAARIHDVHRSSIPERTSRKSSIRSGSASVSA